MKTLQKIKAIIISGVYKIVLACCVSDNTVSVFSRCLIISFWIFLMRKTHPAPTLYYRDSSPQRLLDVNKRLILCVALLGYAA